MSKTKFYLLLVIGVVCFIVWAVAAYLDPAYRADFMRLVEGTTLGLAALVLRDMPPPSTPTAPAVTPTVPAAPAVAQPTV